MGETYAPLYETIGKFAGGATARMAIGAGGLSELSDALWRLFGLHGDDRILLRQPIPALVWRALVRALANPLLLRAAIVLFCATFAFLLGLLFMRLLKQNISEERNFSATAQPTLETLPLHLYNTVIQQLKQQKHELQVQSEAEQRRLRTTENFSQAVLSNLSCGVLVFGMNGLVKTANPAAKAILGFASPTGMGAEDIFRGALVSSGVQTTSTGSEDNGDEAVGMADKIREVLQEESKRCNVEAEYETPAGAKRFIAVTISPVPSTGRGLPDQRHERVGTDPAPTATGRRDFGGEGAATAFVAGHDIQLRAATGQQPRCRNGAATGRGYRARSHGIGPQHWRIFDQNSSRAGSGRG
jgi:PAS domain-containing protein